MHRLLNVRQIRHSAISTVDAMFRNPSHTSLVRGSQRLYRSAIVNFKIQGKPFPMGLTAIGTGWNTSIERMIYKALVTFEVLLLLLSPVAAQSSSNSFGDLVAQANSARQQGDITGAINLYQKAVRVNPEWPDGWWYLGSLQYGTNDYGPAISALSHYIDLMPKAGPAYALRGLSEFDVEQYPASLQDIQHAIALGAANNPQNAGVLVYHQALLLTRLGLFEAAIAKYKVLIEHGVTSQNVIDGIGLAGLRMPILPKDVDPSQEPLISLVGQAAANVMGGDMDNGHQAFEEVFNRFPSQPHAHYLYGYLLSMVDPSDAVMQFRDELKISPKSALAHSMLAWDLEMQGDYAKALPYAQQSVAEDPSLAMGQLVLGKGLVGTGDMAASLPYLKAVLKTDPQDLEAHLALVQAYSDLGRKDDARRERFLCLSISKKRAIPDENE